MHSSRPSTPPGSDEVWVFADALIAVFRELGFVVVVTVAVYLTARYLLEHVFAGRGHEASELHERLAPRLQRVYSLGGRRPFDPTTLPDLHPAHVDELVRALETVTGDTLTFGELTAYRSRSSHPEVWSALYRAGLVVTGRSADTIGSVRLSDRGRLTLKELRRRQLVAADPVLSVPRAHLGRRVRLRVPEVPLHLVRIRDEVVGVWDLDPATGEDLTWRNGRFYGRRSGSEYAPNGNVYMGPARHGLYTFPVTDDDKEVRIRLDRPRAGEVAEHRTWTDRFRWTSPANQEDG